MALNPESSLSLEGGSITSPNGGTSWGQEPMGALVIQTTNKGRKVFIWALGFLEVSAKLD